MGTYLSTMTLQQEIQRIYQLVPRRNRTTSFPLDSLLSIFKQTPQYSWGSDIPSQFKIAFSHFFSQSWAVQKQFFYNRLLKSSKLGESKNAQSAFIEKIKDSAYLIQQPLTALNNTILNGQQVDFLPLFTQTKKKHRQIEQCSVIFPQTIFIERQTTQAQEKAFELVCFYKHISSSLEQICTRPTVISTPLKHFLCTFLHKIARKKIRKNQSQVHPTLLNPQNQSLRKKRDFNNSLLLQEIRAFTEAYSQFVWNYLEFDTFKGTSIEKLLTIDTVYGVCLKHVWSQVGWIGRRGYEYEDHLLNLYCEGVQRRENATINMFRQLKGEDSPQRYLKKIVVFYREVAKVCENADQLLEHFEEMFIQGVKEGDAREYGLFRMAHLIEQVLKLEQWGAEGGEISYAWTSFCITLEILKSKIAVMAKSITKERQRDGGNRIEELKTFVNNTSCYQNVVLDEEQNDRL